MSLEEWRGGVDAPLAEAPSSEASLKGCGDSLFKLEVGSSVPKRFEPYLVGLLITY